MVGCWGLAEGSGGVTSNLATPNTYDGTFTNSPTWSPGPYGPSVGMLTASTQYITCTSISEINGATFATIFALGNRATTKLWAVGRTNVASNKFDILCFTDDKVYCSVDTGSGNAFSVTNSAVAPTGDFSIGMSYDGTQSAVNRIITYINGSKPAITGSISTPATIPSSAALWEIGTERVNSRYSEGRFDLCMLWVGRRLTDDDFALLHTNPWQVFQPARGIRIFGMPTVAAGSTILIRGFVSGLLVTRGYSSTSPSTYQPWIYGDQIQEMYG